MFEHYSRVPDGVAPPAGAADPQPASGFSAGRQGAQLYRAGQHPLPARLETYNLLERFGVATVLHPDLLAQIDADGPRQHQQHTWEQTNARALVNKMLALDFKYTLADNDLVKVNLACEVAGVDIGYPLLSDALTDFSLCLDPDWKLKGKQLRWFFKGRCAAFAGRDHHQGETRLRPAVRPVAAQTCRPATAGARQPGRPETPQHHPPGFHRHGNEIGGNPPRYYGTMVWILMMLSQWYRHNEHLIGVT